MQREAPLLMGSTAWRSRSRLPRVQQDGHRTVVDEADLHVGSKDAPLRRPAGADVEELQEGFIEWDRLVWSSGPHETGAVPFAGIAQERDLADHQQVTGNRPDVPVHLAVGVWKNPQLHRLACQPFDVGRRIAHFNTEKHQQTGADAGRWPPVNADGGLATRWSPTNAPESCSGCCEA